MPSWDAPERLDTPTVPDGERESLDAWLEYHRATLLIKCAGLTPEQLARRSCPPSTLSLLGLVRHMADVEAWFHDFDGQPVDGIYTAQPDRDVHFDDVDPAHADDDLANLQWAVRRSRAAVAGRSLDDISPDGGDVPYSLRWIYQHMIEEYARHNGHADLLRERIDGATGD
jgi:uncharacterized damage-inducible protein DinB